MGLVKWCEYIFHRKSMTFEALWQNAVSSKFVCWKSNLQHSDIGKWGLWESALRNCFMLSGKSFLTEGVISLWKDTAWFLFSLAVSYGMMEMEQEGLPNHQIWGNRLLLIINYPTLLLCCSHTKWGRCVCVCACRLINFTLTTVTRHVSEEWALRLS